MPSGTSAYHALFYGHLYLQPSESAFAPWPKHRENYNVMSDALPYPPYDKVEIGEPYTKADVLEYLTFCREHIASWVDALDLDGESGFEWLPMNKLELQFYNIRHLQQHVGELSTLLMEHAKVEIDWVGMQPQS